MTNIELLEAFETEINLVNDNINKPLTTDSEYFINLAVEEYVSTRLTGNNYRQVGVEGDQKRIDDLRRLMMNVNLLVDNHGETDYEVYLPDYYRHLLGVTVSILPISDNAKACWPKDGNGNFVQIKTDPIEVTTDTVDAQRRNSLSEHHLRYSSARPLQLQRGLSLVYYTDKNYKVDSVNVDYLMGPSRISFSDPNNAFNTLTDFEDYAYYEIIKLAARKYIDSKANSYETKQNEVNLTE